MLSQYIINVIRIEILPAIAFRCSRQTLEHGRGSLLQGHCQKLWRSYFTTEHYKKPSPAFIISFNHTIDAVGVIDFLTSHIWEPTFVAAGFVCHGFYGNS